MNATNIKLLGLGIGLAGWLALSIVVPFTDGIATVIAMGGAATSGMIVGVILAITKFEKTKGKP